MLGRTVVAGYSSAWELRRHPSPLSRSLACVLAAVVFVLLALGARVARAESLCTDTWTGPSEGAWETAADWSSGKAPSSLDVACVGSGKTVKVEPGVTAHAGSLAVEGTLIIKGGTLEPTGGLSGEVSTVSELTQTNGGWLDGEGTVDVTKTFTWTSEGTMTGHGRLVLTKSGTGSGNNYITVKGYTFVNEGEWSFSAGSIRMSEGGRFENDGVFYTSEKGTVFQMESTEGGIPRVVNSGLFERRSAAETTYVGVPFENTGRVYVAGGTLEFNSSVGASSSTSGTWEAASGASLKVYDHEMSSHKDMWSGAVSVGGMAVSELEAKTGQVTVEGTLSVESGTSTAEALTFASGTISGAGTLDVTKSFSWTGKESTMTGSGRMVLAKGAVGTIAPGGTERFWDYLRGGYTLINEGELSSSYGEIFMSEGAIFKNTGTYYTSATTEVFSYQSGGASPRVINTGLFERRSGPEGSYMSVPFENTGRVYAAGGYLDFNSSTGSSSSTGGEWSAAAGASVRIYAHEMSSHNDTWRDSIYVSETTVAGLEAQHAQVTVEGPFSVESGTVAVESLSFMGGTLTGAGTLDVVDSFLWGGKRNTMTGSGRLVLEKSATGRIHIEGAEQIYAYLKGGYTFVNEGALSMDDGTIEMSEGALFKNVGSVYLEGNGTEFYQESGNVSIDNAGLLEKRGGKETSVIAVSFYNSGTVYAAVGKILFEHPVSPVQGTQYGPLNPSELSQLRSECGDPVNCVTGNLFESQGDIATGGRGVGLNLTRYYNAQTAAGERGAFGYGWSSLFSDRVVYSESAKTATVVQANASTVPFSEEAGGIWKAPAWTQDTLAGNGSEGYTLTLADQRVYRFSGAGRLESVTDRDGNKTSLGYNEKGQLVTITDPASRTIKLAYNGEGLVESATDPMGRVVKYAYESGNLASVTMPGESSPRWKFKYDASHRMTSMTNGLGGETKNTYNEANQVISQTGPTGHTLKWEYEPFRTKITNESTGSVTVEQYTSGDKVDSLTRGYGTEHATTETFTYNEANEPLTRTDGGGHATTYEYNTAGDRTLETDSEGHETKWAYNAHHQVTSETLPSGETTTIEYDEHGNPIKVSRPAPESKTQEARYEYNAVGELTAMIDPLARKWAYEYDAYGDRTVEVDPEGDKRTWGFNEDSRLTSEVSPRGNVTGGEPAKYTTSIERDAQGRPVKVTEPEAGQGKPVSRMRAAISGGTVEGQTLTAAPGIWEGSPSLSYGYQWERCSATGGSCATVSGATGSTYVLASADVGHTLRVVVSATNSAGSASSTSAITAVVSTAVMPRYSAQFGSKGSGAGQLAYPYGIALDSHGNVWVDDGENDRVDEFSSTGAFVETIGWGVSNGEAKYEVCTSGCRAGIKGSGEGQFNEPAGIAISAGNLYVVDYANDRVEEFNEKSEFVRTFGEKGAGAGQLEGAEMVAAAPGGNLWVSDAGNKRIEEFTSTGAFVETIGWGVGNGESKYEVCTSGCRAGSAGSGNGQFNTPVGVAFGGSNLYVADDVNDRVEEFNEKSEFVRKFGSKGKEAGQFEETTNIGVEASTGDLYANDWADNRIEEFSSTGGFMGQFGASGTANGQFKGPQGIAVTSTGGIYVVDNGNDRIEEWKPVTIPASVVAPSVSGEMIEGQVLTAGAGIWAASPAATYTYQWQRCTSAGASCANITGATSSTYTLATADSGHELRVQVTAKNTGGSTKAFSHTTQTLAGPHTTKYAYNAEGQIESETNAEGQTTTTTYNTAGLPTKVSYPGGQTTETEYDGAGQVVAQTDGNKHTTKYVRNVLEQVTEVIDPISHKTKKTYDGAGNLATLTDPEGRVTTYSYNKENQPSKVSYSEAGTHTVEYAYTVNGQRESMVDGTGTTSYTYDQLGRLSETKDGHGDKVAYAYDLANETTQITYPNGKSVKYEYDKAGRMSSVSDWLSHTTKFAYSADSQQITTTFPEASGESDHYSYTPSGLMSEASFQKGTETLASLSYVRNNTEQLTRTAQTGLPGEAAIEDSYDPNERLTTAGTTSYEYDAANNATKQGSASYTYNAGDELESGGGNTYTFNEEGQRTKTTPASGPATTYGYNQAGYLTTVNRPEEGSTSKIEDSYASNGDGLRVSETIGSKTSYLTWQLTGGLPLLLNDNTNSYIYGPEGLPVEQINGEEHATYIHHDQAGSTRLLTNEKGETTGAYTYTPYGGTESHTGTATTPLGYDGQYTSPDTGLIYLRARVYDPNTAQFLTVDPLAAITGEPYAYAGDDPLTYGDPTGLLFGVELPSLEEIGEGVAGWGDTITFGGTEWVREQLGDNNVNACSGAYQTGGVAGLVTGVLIPGEGEADVAAHVWPETAEGMDEMLGMEGTSVPDGPTTPGRNKVTWEPNPNTKITFEQHPYDKGAPDWHTGPHWHLDSPSGSHERYLPGEPIPGY